MAALAPTAAALAAFHVPAAEPPAPPPPAPGSPGVYVCAMTLEDGLKAAKKNNADLATATVGVTQQYSIHEVLRGKAASPGKSPGAM